MSDGQEISFGETTICAWLGVGSGGRRPSSTMQRVVPAETSAERRRWIFRTSDVDSRRVTDPATCQRGWKVGKLSQTIAIPRFVCNRKAEIIPNDSVVEISPSISRNPCASKCNDEFPSLCDFSSSRLIISLRVCLLVRAFRGHTQRPYSSERILWFVCRTLSHIYLSIWIHRFFTFPTSVGRISEIQGTFSERLRQTFHVPRQWYWTWMQNWNFLQVGFFPNNKAF